MKGTNIKDVAKASGVSVGTVSRVLNRDPSVSTENRELVLNAVNELGYEPLTRTRKQRSAQPLRNHSIALVILGMDRSLVNLPVVAEAVHGAEQAIAVAGGNLLFADSPALEAIPPSLQSGRVDGVILKGPLQGVELATGDTPLLDRLRHLPTVWILGRPKGCWGDCAAASNIHVGTMAANHLIERGHTRLGFINPKGNHVMFYERMMSFCERARCKGLPEVQRFIGGDKESWDLPLHSARDAGNVQQLVDRLLRLKNPPTALFAPADNIAALVYRALAVRGIQVGKRISLISANNEAAIRAMLHPALTTLDINAGMIGRRAVDQLAWRLDHPDEPGIDIGIHPTLIEGGSVNVLRT